MGLGRRLIEKGNPRIDRSIQMVEQADPTTAADTCQIEGGLLLRHRTVDRREARIAEQIKTPVVDEKLVGGEAEQPR